MIDSRMCKLFLQLIFVTLSWSTTIALSFLELAEEDCFGHANVFHPRDVASPAQLHLKQDGLYAAQAGFSHQSWQKEASDRDSWHSSVRKASCEFEAEKHKAAK